MKIGDKYIRMGRKGGIDVAVVMRLGNCVGFKLYYANKDNAIYMEWLISNFNKQWTPTTPLMEALL